MSSASAYDNANKVFQIKSTAEFANRSNSIFHGLNELEEKHSKWNAETPMTLDLQKPEPAASEILDCKIGTFKRPRLPLSLKRKRHEDVVPDYIMNPHKWKKYSLADTPGVTDESNTAVALQFLNELKKNREEQTITDDLESLTYRKPATVDATAPSEHFSPSFTCSSVHKMPELVVGEKRQKTAKATSSNAKVGNAVKLDHLEENFDDVM